ncbi:MAG: ABC transporter permease [Chloroflexi bacterium]|nr:ABC transporter permease [Chloroflexota bacterium]
MEASNSRSTPAPHTGWRLRNLFAAREAGVFIALILMCVFLALTSEAFLSTRNLLNIGRQVSLIGIMAVGMTFVLISGEVDLSVGSTYALAGLVTGMLLIQQWTMLPAIAVGLLIGVGIGVLNGALSTYGKLPSFITTLGMLSIVRGAALLITDGQPVTVNIRQGVLPDVLEQFEFIGQGYLFGQIPMQLVFFIIIAILGAIVLSLTTFGFRVYAVGGGQKAARVSGIRVFSVKVWSFIIMGTLAGLAGILSMAFLPSGQAGRTGLGLELDVIAATIVGGASLSGGEGTIPGTILGVLIIGVLRNGLVLLGISPFAQELIIGLVIIIAVAIDKWTATRRAA